MNKNIHHTHKKAASWGLYISKHKGRKTEIQNRPNDGRSCPGVKHGSNQGTERMMIFSWMHPLSEHRAPQIYACVLTKPDGSCCPGHWKGPLWEANNLHRANCKRFQQPEVSKVQSQQSHSKHT